MGERFRRIIRIIDKSILLFNLINTRILSGNDFGTEKISYTLFIDYRYDLLRVFLYKYSIDCRVPQRKSAGD